MKTEEGWARGRLCGKPPRATGFWVCIICGRGAEIMLDLCFPTRAAQQGQDYERARTPL